MLVSSAAAALPPPVWLYFSEVAHLDGLFFVRRTDGGIYAIRPDLGGLSGLGSFFSSVSDHVKKAVSSATSKIKSVAHDIGSGISKGAKAVGTGLKQGWDVVRQAAPILLPIAATAIGIASGGTLLPALLPAVAPLAAALLAKNPEMPKDQAQAQAQQYLSAGQIPADLVPFLPAGGLPIDMGTIPAEDSKTLPDWIAPAALGAAAIFAVVALQKRR